MTKTPGKDQQSADILEEARRLLGEGRYEQSLEAARRALDLSGNDGAMEKAAKTAVSLAHQELARTAVQRGRDPLLQASTMAEKLNIDHRLAQRGETEYNRTEVQEKLPGKGREFLHLRKQFSAPESRLCEDLLSYFWFPPQKEDGGGDPDQINSKTRGLLAGMDLVAPQGEVPTDLSAFDPSLDFTKLLPVVISSPDELRSSDPRDLLPPPDFKL